MVYLSGYLLIYGESSFLFALAILHDLQIKKTVQARMSATITRIMGMTRELSSLSEFVSSYVLLSIC